MTAELTQAFAKVREGSVDGFWDLLPAFKAGPEIMSMELHFQFAPMFNLRQPQKSLWVCGRQVGKCIHPDSWIQMWDGAYLRARDVKVGDMVVSVDNDLRSHCRPVSGVFDNGPQELLEIKTRMGSVLRVTKNHRLLASSGYREASELRVGDRLAHIRNGGVFAELLQPSPTLRDRVMLTAYLIGDGYIDDSIKFTSDCPAVLDEIESLCGGSYVVRDTKTRSAATEIRFLKKHPAHAWMLEDGLVGSRSADKRIPRWVFELPAEDTMLFLSRLWATDGSLKRYHQQISITYCTISEGLSRDVKGLLCKLGIPASIRFKRTSCGGKECAPAYELRVETRRGQQEFMRLLQVPGKPAVQPVDAPERGNYNAIPLDLCGDLVYSMLDKAVFRRNDSLRTRGARRKLKYPPTPAKLKSLLRVAREMGLRAAPEYSALVSLLSADASWDEIESISDIGVFPTIDFEVEEHHNFIIDGVVSHNTYGLTSQTILRGGSVPSFHTLTIQPRADQTLRYDQTILRPMMRDCLIKDQLFDNRSVQNVAIKELKNGSFIYLDYCFMDPGRIRGYSGLSAVNIDEAQNIEWGFIPIIEETMSASKRFGFTQFTGTPLTTDGTLGMGWNLSSQGEWVIRCQGCNKDNVPSADQDLLKMIGKDTVVCAKCGKGLDCRPPYGRYIHARPDRLDTFVGRHVSQVIHPLHYLYKAKWRKLIDKQNTYGKMKFWNEVLGEPCDESAKLLTPADLRRCMSKFDGTLEKAKKARRFYEGIAIGVDWSGGGALEHSFTAVAALGFRAGSDVLDCVYHKKLPQGASPEDEAQFVLQLMIELDAVYVAHDYGGAGYLRETLLRQAGIPDERIVPFTYVYSTSQDVIKYNQPLGGSRYSYSIDKARSLSVMCAMIRACKITFPKESDTSFGELEDFLNLTEIPKELPRGGTMYVISKRPMTSDDMAHAVNYAASAVWHTRQSYPNLADASRFKIDDAEMRLANPANIDWGVYAEELRGDPLVSQ